MTVLPPSPFLSDSVVSHSATDTAASAETAPLPEAANPNLACSSVVEQGAVNALVAGSSPAMPANPPLQTEVNQEAHPQSLAAGVTDSFGCDISDVGEIFYHAKLLVAEDNAIHRRFVLDVRAFEEAIEPPPIFLQRAG